VALGKTILPNSSDTVYSGLLYNIHPIKLSCAVRNTITNLSESYDITVSISAGGLNVLTYAELGETVNHTIDVFSQLYNTISIIVTNHEAEDIEVIISIQHDYSQDVLVYI
jgi:hypothetical protein